MMDGTKMKGPSKGQTQLLLSGELLRCCFRMTGWQGLEAEAL